MIRQKRKEKFFLVAIFVLSLFLNFYNLEHLPLALHNDEAEHGLEALRILRGESPLIGLSRFYNVPLSGFLHQCLTIWLLGPSVFGLRAASALVGSLSLPLFYYLAKLLFDRKVALLATVLLTGSHFWIAFAHLGINYNLSVLLMIVTFIFLVRLLEGGGLRDSFLLGAFSTSFLYLYFSSRVVPVIVAGVMLFAFFRRSFKPRLKTILVFFLGCLLVALPMIFVYVKNPQGFNSRTRNVFLFSPEVKPWSEDVYRTDQKAKVFWGQVKKSLNLSSKNCESSGQYGYCGRIFGLPTLVLFFLGVFLSFW